MKVAVVIPVFNGEKYIEKTFHAICSLKTGMNELEIIAVDDGSTDNSLQILKKFPLKIISQKNAGPAAARNKGWRSTNAEIVLFTDSDCLPSENWVMCMLDSFTSEDIGAVGGSYDIANHESTLALLVHTEIMLRHNKMPPFVKAAGTYNIAVRKKVLEKVGGFDESFPTSSAEDNDLSYRIRKAGYRIAFNKKCKVAHYHPENVLKYLKSQFVHGFWRVRLYLLHPEFAKGDDYTKMRDILDVFFAGICLISFLCIPLTTRTFYAISILSFLGLLLVEVIVSARIAGMKSRWDLFFLGSLIFTIRAFYRFVGFVFGLTANVFWNKVLRRD